MKSYQKYLLYTLRFKIGITLSCWALPLLFIPAGLAQSSGLDLARPILFARLLGAAYLALAFAYYSAYKQLRKGMEADWVITMGLLSNGSAALILAGSFFTPEFAALAPTSRLFLFGSCLAASLITAGLFIFGIKRPGESELRRFGRLFVKSADQAQGFFGGALVRLRMAYYARRTLRNKRALKKRELLTLETTANEYQRMFPTRKMYRLKKLEGDTAFFEIHSSCPLRGGGDKEACHRLMQYDRSLAKGLDASFEVLESQALTGESTCLVALKKAGSSPLDRS